MQKSVTIKIEKVTIHSRRDCHFFVACGNNLKIEEIREIKKNNFVNNDRKLYVKFDIVRKLNDYL